MPEKVHTGGTKSFVYPKNYKLEKDKQLSSEIKQAYQQHYAKKRRNKIIWIIIILMILLITGYLLIT